MPHTAILGDKEVPVTFSPDDAVGLMRESGIVGAGGAGFPTYVKYQTPPRTMVVNAAESEPGYYADKLLLRDEPEALIDIFDWLDQTFSIDTTIIGAEDVAKPYMTELEELAKDLGNFSIGYFDSKYKYGQERALCKVLLGMEIPASDLPSDHGIVVNNVETLWNMYRAIFQAHPVTTKFLHLYGEVDPLTVYEAPVGTLFTDLLEIHGTDPADVADFQLWDGGPILSDKVADPIGEADPVPVSKTTNGWLVADPSHSQPKNRYYPHPDYEHNSIDVPWAADEIVNVEAEVPRVRVPRDVPFGDQAKLCVEEGESVEIGDTLGHARPGSLSVAIHASIPGTIEAITDAYVEIVR